MCSCGWRVCVCVWLNIVPAKVACTKFCFCCLSLLHSLLSFSLFLFCNNVWSVTQATTPSVAQASCSTSVTRKHTAVSQEPAIDIFVGASVAIHWSFSAQQNYNFWLPFLFSVCWESIERETPFLVWVSSVDDKINKESHSRLESVANEIIVSEHFLDP